jgi:uncharacterized protein YwgA
MFEELLIPLLLTKCLGNLKGKTRFQKLVYLIQKEASSKEVPASSFVYEIHYYGPFSSELSTVLEKLASDHLLEEEMEMTPSGYMRYVYSLTEKGKRLVEDARKKRLISIELERIIEKVANDYGEKQLPDLIAEAYRRYLE